MGIKVDKVETPKHAEPPFHSHPSVVENRMGFTASCQSEQRRVFPLISSCP